MIHLLLAVIYLSFISLGLPDGLPAILALMVWMHEQVLRKTAH